MKTKEQLKGLIDQLPADKVPLIENFINNILFHKTTEPPKNIFYFLKPDTTIQNNKTTHI